MPCDIEGLVIASAMTKKELADALQVSRVALNKWEREGCPVEDVLCESLEDAVAYIKDWRSQHKLPRYQKDLPPDADGDLQQQFLAAQVREKNAAAFAKELKNDETEGRLVDRELIVDEFADFLSQAKPLIEGMVDDIAKESPEELRVMARQVAKNAADRFFRKLAAWRPEIGDA